MFIPTVRSIVVLYIKQKFVIVIDAQSIESKSPFMVTNRFVVSSWLTIKTAQEIEEKA